MISFYYDPVMQEVTTDVNDLKMRFRKTRQHIKNTLMHLKIIVGVIFLAMFFKMLFEVGVTEWYIGLLDSIVTCGVLGVYVYLWDLERKL